MSFDNTMISIDKPSQVNSKNSFSPWLIWGLAASFFVSEYFARVAPSVMAHDLMRDFHVSALALGSLSAFFYYAYIAMQVPVGMLVDRYGPHRLLTTMAVLSAVSCIMFALAQNIAVADLARLLFGFTASFAFVGALKLAAVWFPPQRFGLLSGLTQALGMIGAAVGGPISYATTVIGWRNTMLVIAAIFIAIAALIGLIVRDQPSGTISVKDTLAHGSLLAGLRNVLVNKESWINGLYAGLVYAPTAAFAELWGPSFLTRAYNLEMHVAAYAVGMIFIGWGLGGPTMGWLSDRIGRRRPMMLMSALLGLIFMSIVIYVPGLPLPLLFLLLFLYGVSNTGVAIAYAVAAEINPRGIAGTSMAFANMASVIVGAALQPIIGFILDLHWDGTMVNGIPFYTADHFRVAFLQLPVCLILGIVFAMLVKETYCKSVR